MQLNQARRVGYKTQFTVTHCNKAACGSDAALLQAGAVKLYLECSMCSSAAAG